jgi:diguanylate cyclase (GGDEF)-like protein/PAS domain S-box-containing protein
MTIEITLYAVISVIAAGVAGLVAVIASRRTNTPGGKSLTALMLSVCIWSAGAAMEYATVGIPGKIFWAKIEYFGVVSCPVFFLLFAVEYNLLYRWLTPRKIAILFILPLITLGLALTNEWHGLIWSSFTPSLAGDNLVVFGHGVGFWVGAVGYSYLCMLAGTVVLIWGTFRLPKEFHNQVILIAAAAIAPWVVNLVYIARLGPLPGLELTPLVILISGTIFGWDILQFHLLDLVPIARHTLIETMADGILVLDQQNRVLDANPAARQLLGEKAVITIGKYIGDIFDSSPELMKLFIQNNPETNTEVTVESTRGRYLEISLSPVHDWRGFFRGQFVVMRDITERRCSQDKIQLMNERLRVQLTEIETLQAHLMELAIRDSLTGLFNRRYLDETLVRELSRAKRGNYEISILMIDIDHFKHINDTYGHKAGDQVLKSMGDFLQGEVRQGDIVCRLGGDEFLIIMPGMQLKDAQNRAEMICNDASQLSIRHEEMELRITVSIGVVVFPQHGDSADDIIRAADSAMYAAKQAGRNTVRVK